MPKQMVIVENQDGHIKVNELTARNVKLHTSAGKVQCETINGDIEFAQKTAAFLLIN